VKKDNWPERERAREREREREGEANGEGKNNENGVVPLIFFSYFFTFFNSNRYQNISIFFTFYII